jgi:hypothetical protein
MKEVMTLSAFYFTPIPPPTNAVNPSPEKKKQTPSIHIYSELPGLIPEISRYSQ